MASAPVAEPSQILDYMGQVTWAHFERAGATLSVLPASLFPVAR